MTDNQLFQKKNSKQCERRKENSKVANKTEIMQIIHQTDEILPGKGYLFVNSNEKISL